MSVLRIENSKKAIVDHRFDITVFFRTFVLDNGVQPGIIPGELNRESGLIPELCPQL